MEKPGLEQSNELNASQPINPDIGVQFLLADFESIRSFKEQSVLIGDRRIDIFLALTTALTGGLCLLVTAKIDPRLILFLTLCSSGGMFVIGLFTFFQVIDRDISIVNYIHAINCIRGYFSEKYPDIIPYLLLPTDKMFPKYNWKPSNRGIPMTINGLLVGTLIIAVRLFYLNISTPSMESVWILISAFFATFLLQEGYAQIVFKRAGKNAYNV
jgi:hypothetical protein